MNATSFMHTNCRLTSQNNILSQVNTRSFFSGQKKNKEEPQVKEDKEEEVKSEKEEKVEEAAVEDKGDVKEDKDTAQASQSDESELELSSEDIKAIQKLIKEQDAKIDKQEKKIED